MSKETVVKVKQPEGKEPIAGEIIADAIVRIADAADRMKRSGLNRRALLVLLKDYSGVPQRDIGLVLDGLELLRKKYTTK